ncbi:lantibiotic dehydratase [Nocardiopsis metallicus]|uniref:Thiopeptide-type bacteriocin biosynthesis protein n=1 Tax=Nocardiopsis metallicus TaxID=179819 RepID=A0A840WCQ4_9ACTN|nr:lantibiotic dehydratase [Nocardiopsis metallicus]MBB5494800.1 thiopeptide-type bacteriocin biosynthesis protein [Nocardiopsis metallicus]
MYRLLHSAALTLRATTQPPIDDPSPWPDPDRADPEQLRTWTVDTWQTSLGLADALDVASPSLTRRLHTLAGPDPVPARKVRRTAVSLMRYLLRAQTRPTPHGLLAGVAPFTTGERTHVRWGSDHRPVARPDAAWISAFSRAHADRHDHDPLVVASRVAHLQGDRWVLPWAAGTSNPQTAVSESVRHTPVVAHLMASAQHPTRVGVLIDGLAHAYPDTDRAVITDAVDLLLQRRFLISAARPPTWATEPLHHLAQHQPLHPALQDARAALEDHNHPATPPEQRRALRPTVIEHLARAHPDDAALAVDTRLDVDLTLPATALSPALDATRHLARLAPDQEGDPVWVDYHTRCLETYGPGAQVPLLDLISPSGIGLPATYRGSHLPPPTASGHNRQRNRALLAAAHTAALHGLAEIVVENTPALDALNPPARPAPHLELRLQVHAATPGVIDAGEHTLWITGVSRGVGTLTGRFSHLPGMADHNAFTTLPTLTRGALPVQILAPPMADTATHISRALPLAPYVLPIDEHPPPGKEAIALPHLTVRIDTDRLRLVDTHRDRVIEPFLASALEPHHYTHPLARLCYELPRARTTPHLMFTWPATTSTYTHLPRMRTGPVIVAPAQWRVNATDDLHRIRPALPSRVLLIDGERHLALDLDQPAHRHLLRTHLDRHHTATLTEAPALDAFGWCQGRAHEIVLPLACTAPPTPAPTRLSPPVPAKQTTPARPDRQWMSVHLYTDPHLFTPLLTDHLTHVWSLLGHTPQWWFVRYNDSVGPHLRLRLHTPPGHPDPTHALGAWAENLRTAGMLRSWSLHPYLPETGRYGEGATLASAHTLFEADAAAALTQLRAADHDPSRTHALTAVSLLHLITTAQNTNWAVNHLPRSRTPLDRPTLALAEQLWEQLLTRRLPEPLFQAWHERTTALTTYLHHLGSASATTVLPSLLHMHHNRVHGPDRDDEHRTHALARTIALAHQHRHEAAPQ